MELYITSLTLFRLLAVLFFKRRAAARVKYFICDDTYCEVHPRA